MKPSRRDLIASFLGLAVADAACRRREAPPLSGVLVDAAHETGHLLRGAPLPRAGEVSRVLDVLVVGAGAAGLSAAWRLRGAGHTDFLVAELDLEPGGTARAGRNEVSAFPWGAHYLPAPLSASGPVPRLLTEMGVMSGVGDDGAPKLAEEALIREPEERLFHLGTWYEGLYLRAGASSDDLAQLERFEQAMAAFAAARDGRGRKAFAVPMEAGSDDAEWSQLDRLSMAQWMESQRFTSKRLLWLVEYACRDDYGASAAGTSAWAGIWYFAARQTGASRSEGFLSWPEGNGRLIAQLRSSAGAERLRLKLLVHALEAVEGRWRAHAWDAAANAPVALEARQVVLACPQFVAARLVPPRAQGAAAFRYSPWAVANVTLSRAPASRGFPLAWDNVLYASKSLGYVVATHQRPRASDVGATVFTWYYPLVGDDPKVERTRLLGTTHADWSALVRADLSPAHQGFDELAQRVDVMRWGHAMVRPYPGFVWGGARQAAGESIGGTLHFAHSDLGGLAMFEEANHHGVRAAEAVLRGLGREAQTWLDRSW
jgi:protoporphyrinogen oxidase